MGGGGPWVLWGSGFEENRNTPPCLAQSVSVPSEPCGGVKIKNRRKALGEHDHRHIEVQLLLELVQYIRT